MPSWSVQRASTEDARRFVRGLRLPTPTFSITTVWRNKSFGAKAVSILNRRITMKYRAKGTIEAVQLKDPLEVANWFAKVLPEWGFFHVNNREYLVMRPDRSLPSEYILDGRWVILSEGDTKPLVISEGLFQSRFEPATPPFASGGYVQKPTSPWVVKDGRVFLKEDVKVADSLKGLVSNPFGPFQKLDIEASLKATPPPVPPRPTPKKGWRWW